MSDQLILGLAAAASVATLIIVLVQISRGRSFDEQKIRAALMAEMRTSREEAAKSAREQRTELREAYAAAAQEGRDNLTKFSKDQQDALGVHARATVEAVEKLRETLASSVKQLQEGNEKKLEEMRATVDEKLQGTLEKRLGESFKLVSERLEAVQRGLGEMHALAAGVGDLKKVLSNVSTRGAFGEMQLHSILRQILAPEQYVANFAPRSEESERVEFAIVLPGRGPGDSIHLPIDSKFPQEDYLRLIDAIERADPTAMADARAALMRSVRSYAKDVHSKYINPPVTTDFALVFLPTEGLFAEVLQHPAIVEELQRKHSIVVVGPTTCAALLNSLRMGFRTLALEKRSSEVWQVLGAVKTEFTKFGQVIERAKKQLNTATKTLDETGVRTRAMERQLRAVESVSADLSESVLGLSGQALLAAAEDLDLPGDPAPTDVEEQPS